ncbi:MAG: hypothetical protein ABIH34_06500 [Nanoarchaeota archaeon]
MLREAEILDKENMEAVIANFFKQCHDATKLGSKIVLKGKPEAIVIAGMAALQ